ncbi:MAG: hypothetical protein QXG86_02305 [Candidatus Woesearchaeota archaeon]
MGDVSKKTLAVLLLVAIVLSTIATWKILSNEPKVVVLEKKEGSSHVSFNIVGEQKPAEPVVKTGKVSIKIE